MVRAGQFLLLFTAFGDTYPSKMQAKHQVASSNTEKHNEFRTCSSLMLGGPLREGVERNPTNDEKMTVLRMGLPIVENLSGPQESIFSLFGGPQLNSLDKSTH